MRRVFLVVAIVALAATGCIKPRPNTKPAAAPLDVPPPPPRVIVPPEPEQPPEETAPEEPEAVKEKRPTRPRPQPPRERPEVAKPPETKPEPPPAETPKATEAVTGPLQAMPASQSQQEMKKQVEAQLAQASRDLGRVDVRTLSADAKTQYDAAKQFITQAVNALREGNLVFAQKLAEKAVGLASNLAPR